MGATPPVAVKSVERRGANRVSTRLTFGLATLFLLVLLVSGGAVRQTLSLLAWSDTLIDEHFEIVLEAEKLVQRTLMLVQLTPRLQTARNAFEIDNLVSQIDDMFGTLDSGFDKLGRSRIPPDRYREITARRGELRAAMDIEIDLIRRQVTLNAAVLADRRRIDALINAGTTETDATGARPSRSAATLAALLFQASVAVSPQQIERDATAVRTLIASAPDEFRALDSSIEILTAGEQSIFKLRADELEGSRRLQGAMGDANLRANRLVYAVANLAAELRETVAKERAARGARADRAALRLGFVVAVAAAIACALVIYLRRNVIRRLVELRDSVQANAAGQAVPITDDGADEVGDLARSVRHFIDEIEHREEELRRLATTDVLTGVANRRAFLAEAEKELARCRRMGRSLCVLMMDIDHFKRVNDTWGHAVGDEVIRRVAKLGGEVFRAIDLVGRLGGEEFAVLMPETVLSDAIVGAERMRAAIKAHVFTLENGQSFQVTISIGAAEMGGDDRDVGGLLERADAALYVAKGSGRDQVRAADPPPVAVTTPAAV